MSAQSTRKGRGGKSPDRPKKPYEGFPLYPHPLGYWAKKVAGKIRYFGRWATRVDGKLVPVLGDGHLQALELWNEQRDDLYGRRQPRVTRDHSGKLVRATSGLTVEDLCNRFLQAKLQKLESEEITPRTFAEYRQTTDQIVKTFDNGSRLVSDLSPDDFATLRAKLAKRYGPVRLGTEIQKVRIVFKLAEKRRWIEREVDYGDGFEKPSKAIIRKHRAARGHRLFEASELRQLIDAAGTPLKAMILLGINAAFGNSDCGELSQSSLDLKNGWVTFPRPKTGIARRARLWPETINAIKAALAERPATEDEAIADTVFLTKFGRPWVRPLEVDARGEQIAAPIDSVSFEFNKLLTKQSMKRPGLGFYALRHTFRTVADSTRDLPAVRLVMGHADGSIDDVYRERIDDGRLQAIADHVRAWLFPTTNADGVPGKSKKRNRKSTAASSKDSGSSDHRTHASLRLYVG